MLLTATNESLEQLWVDAEFVALGKSNSIETLPGSHLSSLSGSSAAHGNDNSKLSLQSWGAAYGDMTLSPALYSPLAAAEHRKHWRSANLPATSLLR